MLVAFLFAFFWKRSTKYGILSGLIIAVLFLFIYQGPMPFALNKGLCALVINFAIAIPVSLISKPSDLTIKRFEIFKKTPPNKPISVSESAS